MRARTMDDEKVGDVPAHTHPTQTHQISATAGTPTNALAIAAGPVGSIVAEHANCLRRIKLCYGADNQTFENELMPLIRGYASYVHLLPASPAGAFCEPGGLLRLGLETGLYSLQGTDSHIIAGRASISVRRQLEPRWRLATFIAGMCCELHRAVSQLIVQSNPDCRWPAYLTPLSNWLDEEKLTHYSVQWWDARREVRSTGLLAMSMVLPRHVAVYLAQHNHTIVPQLMQCVGGLRSHLERNVLDDLVQRALALVIDQELRSRASRGALPPAAEHLERYLLTALRRIAATRASWSPNAEKSRVWLGKDGLFLVWPAAADDLRRQLEFEQWPGIPRTADALLDALLTTGLAQACQAEQPLWPIQPPGPKGPMDALKLASPLVLYAMDPNIPAALDRDLVNTTPRQPTQARSADEARATVRLEQAGLAQPVVASASTSASASIASMESASTLAVTPPPVFSSTREPQPNPSGASPQPARPRSQPAATTASANRHTLRAPIRLPPTIRDALGAIVESLDGGLLPAQCCAVHGGYFIPMRAFAQLGLQPPTVVRALDDARMLLRPDDGGSVNVTGTFDGESLPGVILLDRHVVFSGREGHAASSTSTSTSTSASTPTATTTTTTTHVAAPI